MSISAQARTGRIDNEASRLFKEASRINSSFAGLIGEVNAFAAFMYSNPEGEFTEADITKYRAEFQATLAEIQTTMGGLTGMVAVATGQITPEQFLAQYQGDIPAYSERFNKG